MILKQTVCKIIEILTADVAAYTLYTILLFFVNLCLRAPQGLGPTSPFFKEALGMRNEYRAIEIAGLAHVANP